MESLNDMVIGPATQHRETQLPLETYNNMKIVFVLPYASPDVGRNKT